MRAVLQSLLLLPVVRWFCRPIRVLGADRIPEGPVVFVANHSSHVDTAAVILALPRARRSRLAPAAAQDYFFGGGLGGRARALVVPALVGAFPFPRSGRTGIERCRELLAAGASVLLFPEGTRGPGARVAAFKPGIALLGRSGATIVPVGLAGTARILPKKRRMPHRAPVAVVFGHPRRYPASEQPESVAGDLRSEVCRLVQRAEQIKVARAPLFDTARRFARSRGALVISFVWGAAEALWWPVVPDFLIAPLAIAAPARFPMLALTAIAGSVTGGAWAYLAGVTDAGAWLTARLWLVTPRMHLQAERWLSDLGDLALFRQPLSGIPYKVFAYRSQDAGVPFGGFLLVGAVARGARLFGVAGAFALGGWLLRRLWRRTYGPFLCAYAALFAWGLLRTVAYWS